MSVVCIEVGQVPEAGTAEQSCSVGKLPRFRSSPESWHTAGPGTGMRVFSLRRIPVAMLCVRGCMPEKHTVHDVLQQQALDPAVTHVQACNCGQHHFCKQHATSAHRPMLYAEMRRHAAHGCV